MSEQPYTTPAGAPEPGANENTVSPVAAPAHGAYGDAAYSAGTGASSTGAEPAQGGWSHLPPPVPPMPPHAPGESPEQGPQAPRPRRRLRGTVALVAAVAVVSALAGGVAGGFISAKSTGGASYTTGAVVTSDKSTTNPTAAIAAAVTPSVVRIDVTDGNSTDTGTGVILTSGGQILTNYHVISAAVTNGGTIKITFSDGKTTTATVTGTDASLDVAVIRAQNVSGLKTVSLGDSSKVAVGDSVVAIGNPDGLTDTVTSGIVSALNRKVTVQVDEATTQSNGGFGWPSWSGQDGYGFGSGSGSSSSGQTATYNAIQTDASLNPGNSGGPLLNSAGEVIGINSAMYSSSGSSSSSSSAGSVGLGFAIPINAVKAVLAQLQNGHSITS
jgi:putative serine protease PepD